jgi:hypothetical protein
MQWLDVAGPPGVGKSALCDPIFGPHDVAPVDIAPPVEFHDFCNEVTRLLGLVRDHPSFVAAVRMNRRSMRKMAAVAQADYTEKWPDGFDLRLRAGGKHDLTIGYIQTGFVQRGLGFGWRLVDMGKPVEELYHFFRLMPASLGVVFLEADEATLTERNKAREKVKETSHENRAFMAPLMAPAIEFAKEALRERGVPVKCISTTGDIDAARAELVGFAEERARDFKPHIKTVRPPYLEPRQPKASRHSGEAPVLSPPAWW